MRYLIQSTEGASVMRLITLLAISLTVVGCGGLKRQSVAYPNNLDVIVTKDDWVCLSPDSARRLSEFKADLEAK